MKIENNKIVEATEDELYVYWLEHWDNLYAFDEYLQRMKDLGVKIIDS